MKKIVKKMPKYTFFKGINSSKAWKIFVAIWIIFATLYVFIGEYNRIQLTVAKVAYNRGVSATIGKVMTEAVKCQPFPVTLDGKQVTLISLECLNKSKEEATTAE